MKQCKERCMFLVSTTRPILTHVTSIHNLLDGYLLPKNGCSCSGSKHVYVWIVHTYMSSTLLGGSLRMACRLCYPLIYVIICLTICIVCWTHTKQMIFILYCLKCGHDETSRPSLYDRVWTSARVPRDLKLMLAIR